VIPTAELTGSFERNDVATFFDHTDHTRVATRIGTDRTEIVLGEVETARTKPNPCLGFGDGRGQTLDVLGREFEQVERDALRRTRPDSGQATQLIDQVLNGKRVRGGHGSGVSVHELGIGESLEEFFLGGLRGDRGQLLDFVDVDLFVDDSRLLGRSFR